MFLSPWGIEGLVWKDGSSINLAIFLSAMVEKKAPSTNPRDKNRDLVPYVHARLYNKKREVECSRQDIIRKRDSNMVPT
jgi:hypothetical protein